MDSRLRPSELNLLQAGSRQKSEKAGPGSCTLKSLSAIACRRSAKMRNDVGLAKVACEGALDTLGTGHLG